MCTVAGRSMSLAGDGSAVWVPPTRWWQLLPDLYPLHPMNQALIVLNSQIGLRMLSFVLELVSVILIVTLVLLPTREDSSDSTDGYRWSGCSSPNKNGTSAPTMLPTPGPALTLSPTTSRGMMVIPGSAERAFPPPTSSAIVGLGVPSISRHASPTLNGSYSRRSRAMTSSVYTGFHPS